MINFVNSKNEHDMLVQIFNQQRSHMEVYAEIEDENGLLQTPDIPVDIQSRFGQARLKDFAWRITEELGEVLESIEENSHQPVFYETEIADVLHFLTEFTILAGMGPKDLISKDANLDSNDYLIILYDLIKDNIPSLKFFTKPDSKLTLAIFTTGIIIQRLAMTCNLLKNKPWKRSVKETDYEELKERIRGVWAAYLTLCGALDIGPEKLHALYFKKSDVNKIRQETGY